jgi:hypothetical protein
MLREPQQSGDLFLISIFLFFILFDFFFHNHSS